MKSKGMLIWIIIFIAMGCSPMSPLDEALEKSGDRRVHWEQVLHHYSSREEDSLKYKAACFLIANMPGHGWYEGAILDEYCHWVDSVYAHTDFVFKQVLKEAFFQQRGAVCDLEKHEDLLCLDSTFLITHIDSTFSAIARRPWLRTLSFKQLCEYILPYRVGHERPRHLFHLQDSLFKHKVLVLLNYDDLRCNANEIFKRCRINEAYGVMIDLPYRGRLVNYELIGCVPVAVSAAWWGKVLMCPVVVDINPALPDRNGQHCWAVMADNSRSNRLTEIAHLVNGKGKIYRRTFSKCGRKGNGNEYAPSFFQEVFYRDVTALYTSVEDVSIRPKIPLKVSTAYLCVFNNLAWQPVAQTVLENGIFHFKDMGCGVVYLPVIYQDGEQIALSAPFLLESDGQIRNLLPDTLSCLTLELMRKYPFEYEDALVNEPFLDAVLEASNVADFSTKDCIGVFDTITLQQWADASMNSKQAYRYWRIRSSSSFVFGECFLYDMNGQRLVPRFMGQRDSLEVLTAFDNNPLSYARSDRNGCFTLDFGKKVMVSQVACMLRNDGNNVWQGHWYELFYHDGRDWCSLGIQVAKGRSLIYKVPVGALLWLRDLTAGVEERIFTYDNGQVYYW